MATDQEENHRHLTRFSDDHHHHHHQTPTDETVSMECPFSEVGCTHRLYTDGAYHDHLTENTEQHLQMVMDLHRRSLSTSLDDPECPPDPMVVISPLEKLEAIKTEVDFLESILENSGITQIPALECIRTQLLLPDIIIKKLGDHCTFRMNDYSSLRKSGKKWISPHFTVRGGYKMCLVVYPSGIGSGAGSHLSLSLLLLFDDQLEWPISLPSHVGIRVEVITETGIASAATSFDEVTSNEDINGHLTGSLAKTLEVTWTPENKSEVSDHIAKATAKHHLSSSKKRASFSEHKTKGPLTNESVRLARIFPPWCQQPSSIATTSMNSSNISDQGTNQSSSVLEEEEEEEQEEEEGKYSHGGNYGSSSGHHHQHTELGDRSFDDDDGGSNVEKANNHERDDDLGGMTLFTAEQIASHDQIERYVADYNSLVFQVTLCLT